ncbi:hypothetical protein FLJU110815_05095 [Flavobacterium jumunjinense]|uniref:hypothetical protein n=1 Tax=Flavobacterium sp. TaxID=239 RepID=UPI0039F3E45F
MRFLRNIGVRILLGLMLSGMVFDLVEPNLETTVPLILFKIIVACVFYYFLTIYVNSRKS